MAIEVAPYLQFYGTARPAMEFYAEVFGVPLGGVETYGAFGFAVSPEQADLVMHSQLERDGRAFLMAADLTEAAPAAPGRPTSAVSLFAGAEDAVEMHRRWDLLAADAIEVVEPLARAPWGDEFGMVVDKFGTYWMVNIGGDGLD